MTFTTIEPGGWQVVCPPRKRIRNAALSLASIISGTLLLLMSVGGMLHVSDTAPGGLEIFAYGWLGPLAVIALLLMVLGLKIGARIWLAEILESDGTVVRYHTRGPAWSGVVFEEPADLMLPIEVPDLSPDDAHSFRGPVRLEFAASESDQRRSHLCLMETSHEEYRWLAASINPFARHQNS